jgi:hypothetical protein
MADFNLLPHAITHITINIRNKPPATPKIKGILLEDVSDWMMWVLFFDGVL